MIIDIARNQKTTESAIYLNDCFESFFKDDPIFCIKRFLAENINLECFDNIGTWSSDKYLRIKLFANQHCEVILLCWDQDQAAPKHNHNQQDCYVYSIDGVFEEKIYDAQDPNKLISTSQILPNEVTQMLSTDNYHSLENKTGKRAKSLHFYAKPIEKCEVFDKDSNQFIERTLSYDCCVNDFI